MKRLIAIIGPTGIGKSRLAVYLAKLFPGEIINADSRQIYRYMDIGTAKPAPQEIVQIPHHLIDIINPDEDFSLARYQELAYTTIDDILRRNKLPFLVGGSGMYVKAVLEGWQVPRVSPDHELRYNLAKIASEDSIDRLYEELVNIDPHAAEKIDRRNVRRVIRALEVHKKAQRRFSELGYKQPPPFDSFIIGLTTDRPSLYHMVDQRIDEMMEKGFIQEVETLMKIGYDLALPAMSSIGYREVGQIIRGELSQESAIKKIKTATHRFIRHQYAWFRLGDTKIKWFDIKLQPEEAIEKILTEYLTGV